MLFNALFWCINSRSKYQKFPVMLLCLGEPPVRFLWCWLLFFIHCCSSFIDVYTFLSYFSMPPALHPGFSDPWRGLPALSSTLATFNWFCFFINRERYDFEWAFFTHMHFLPYSPSPTFLTLPDFFKVSLGAGSSSLTFAGLHADPRNTDPAHLFVWFTAIHNLHIQKNSILVPNIIMNYLW